MHDRVWTTALAMLLLCGAAAHGQEWRGMGRVGGKVVDEAGKPIEGVTVKATLPDSGNEGPSPGKTNNKGEWAVGGLARGNWALDFTKESYETKSLSVSVAELSRIPPMEVVMKKAAPVVDPNAEIKQKLVEAAALMNSKSYAAARAIYEELAAKYPEVPQFRPLIARTYYGEGDKVRAIEHLRKAAEQDPGNVEVQMLLANMLIETGKGDEGRKILASIDESKVKDSTVYLNVGIGMINEGKHADAIGWFDKAIAKFPDQPDAYYYRGISYVSLGKTAEAKADLEKFVAIAPKDAPELPTAKKILDTIK